MPKMRWFYTNKAKFKALLFIIALVLIAIQVWFTQKIVHKLRDDQRELIRMNAQIYSYVAESSADADFNQMLLIIKQINIPVILSSADGEPQGYKEISAVSDTTFPMSSETIEALKKIAKELNWNI